MSSPTSAPSTQQIAAGHLALTCASRDRVVVAWRRGQPARRRRPAWPDRVTPEPLTRRRWGSVNARICRGAGVAIRTEGSAV